VEILHLTWASLLTIGTDAPCNAEGLLFGRMHNIIESFRLVGEAGSASTLDGGKRTLSSLAKQLVQGKEKEGQQLLGWCSIRRRESFEPSKLPSPDGLRVSERHLHEAVEAALRGRSSQLVGCYVTCRTGQLGIFSLDAFAVDAGQKPLSLHVRSVGSTVGVGVGGASPPLMPVTGKLAASVHNMATQLATVSISLENTTAEKLEEVQQRASAMDTAGDAYLDMQTQELGGPRPWGRSQGTASPRESSFAGKVLEVTVAEDTEQGQGPGRRNSGAVAAQSSAGRVSEQGQGPVRRNLEAVTAPQSSAGRVSEQGQGPGRRDSGSAAAPQSSAGRDQQQDTAEQVIPAQQEASAKRRRKS